MSMFFTSQLENNRQTVETSLFFFNVNFFYSEIRFEKLISAHEAKSRLKMRDLDL